MAATIGYSPSVISVVSQVRHTNGIHIFPDRPGHDQRTYECPRCEHEVTEVFQLERAELAN